MPQDSLVFRLADIAGLAQVQFQQAYNEIDPLIGVNRQMRQQGFAMDLITIDCITNNQRITLLLDDTDTDNVQYQFSEIDQDPSTTFKKMPLAELDQQGFFDLMVKGLTGE